MAADPTNPISFRIDKELTKREYFALHLMQGMLANRKLVEWGDYNAYSLAIEAVHAADALIQELNK